MYDLKGRIEFLFNSALHNGINYFCKEMANYWLKILQQI